MNSDQDLIQAYLNQSLSDEELEIFMQRLEQEVELRQELRRWLSLDSNLNECLNQDEAPSNTSLQDETLVIAFPKSQNWKFALVACLSFLAGLSFWWLSQQKAPSRIMAQNPLQEETAMGYAVVEKLVDVEWSDKEQSYQNGDAIGHETLKFDQGLVQLEFFCGASVIIEGPAELQLESSWRAFCTQGKIRAHVPPAARGFIIDTKQTRIVDLGTEFGLTVDEDKARVEVFDGKIRLENSTNPAHEMNAGDALSFDAAGQTASTSVKADTFIDRDKFLLEAQQNQEKKFQGWQRQLLHYQQDPSLIAHYRMDQRPLIDNQVGDKDWQEITRGKVILAQSSKGRWGDLAPESALQFNTPGSRVRVKIPGELEAVSFVTWVRIDALNRKLNGLFLTDGFDKNEPHWQINEKGQVIFTVMENEQAMQKQLKSKGYLKEPDYHTPFRSRPIWNSSQRGQWQHLVTTCDPKTQRVAHYLNGQLIDSFKSTKITAPLRIGNAEIGNWGRPIGSGPKYSIRTLNGCIDDFMIFKRALNVDEVKQLYQSSRHD